MKLNITKEWLMKNIDLEEGMSCAAGSFPQFGSSGIDLVGDIHSCADELLELVYKLGYYVGCHGWSHPEGRVIVCVGDFFDKGSKPIDTFRLLERLMESGVALGVLGNHDHKLRRYLRKKRDGISTKDMKLTNGLDETIREFVHAGLEFEVLAWLETLPETIQIGSVLITHGAYREGVSAGHAHNLSMFGEVLSQQPTADVYPQRVDSWKHDYDGDLTHIVVGHEIFEEPQIVVSKSGCKIFSIDTGLADGGKLTALRLPQEEFVYVRAREKYWTQQAK